MSDNIFNELIDIDSSEEKENIDITENFKRATNNLFKYIKHQTGYDVVDVEVLDDYFTFDNKPYSVIHFHIKQCKHWKFAIWWYDFKDNSNEVYGEFFIRNEDDLSKFNPGRSAYCYSIEENYFDSNIPFILKFIHVHPLRAWQRDMYWNHPSGIKCLSNYISYHFNKRKDKIITKILDKIFLSYVYKNALPFADYLDETNEYCEANIIDLGENITPRYEIQCIIPADASTEPGCYDLFYKSDDKAQNTIMKAESERWENLYNRLNKISILLHAYWFIPVYPMVLYYKQKDIEEVEIDLEEI